MVDLTSNLDSDLWEWMTDEHQKEERNRGISVPLPNIVAAAKSIAKEEKLQKEDEDKKKLKICLENIRKLVITARYQIKQLEEENKILRERQDSDPVIRCPSCKLMFKSKKQRVYPHYIKAYPGRFVLELTFKGKEELMEYMRASQLETDENGIPVLAEKKIEKPKGLSEAKSTIGRKLEEKQRADKLAKETAVESNSTVSMVSTSKDSPSSSEELNRKTDSEKKTQPSIKQKPSEKQKGDDNDRKREDARLFQGIPLKYKESKTIIINDKKRECVTFLPVERLIQKKQPSIGAESPLSDRLVISETPPYEPNEKENVNEKSQEKKEPLKRKRSPLKSQLERRTEPGMKVKEKSLSESRKLFLHREKEKEQKEKVREDRHKKKNKQKEISYEKAEKNTKKVEEAFKISSRLLKSRISRKIEDSKLEEMAEIAEETSHKVFAVSLIHSTTSLATFHTDNTSVSSPKKKAKIQVDDEEFEVVDEEEFEVGNPSQSHEEMEELDYSEDTIMFGVERPNGIVFRNRSPFVHKRSPQEDRIELVNGGTGQRKKSNDKFDVEEEDFYKLPQEEKGESSSIGEIPSEEREDFSIFGEVVYEDADILDENYESPSDEDFY